MCICVCVCACVFVYVFVCVCGERVCCNVDREGESMLRCTSEFVDGFGKFVGAGVVLVNVYFGDKCFCVHVFVEITEEFASWVSSDLFLFLFFCFWGKC